MSPAERTPTQYTPPASAEDNLARLLEEILKRTEQPFAPRPLSPEAQRAAQVYDDIRRTLDHDNPPRDNPPAANQQR